MMRKMGYMMKKDMKEQNSGRVIISVWWKNGDKKLKKIQKERVNKCMNNKWVNN